MDPCVGWIGWVIAHPDSIAYAEAGWAGCDVGGHSVGASIRCGKGEYRSIVVGAESPITSRSLHAHNLAGCFSTVAKEFDCPARGNRGVDQRARANDEEQIVDDFV